MPACAFGWILIAFSDPSRVHGGGEASACTSCGFGAGVNLWGALRACMHAGMRVVTARLSAFTGVCHCVGLVCFEYYFDKTFSNGCLGSRIDEGRSEMRYAL